MTGIQLLIFSLLWEIDRSDEGVFPLLPYTTPDRRMLGRRGTPEKKFHEERKIS